MRAARLGHWKLGIPVRLLGLAVVGLALAGCGAFLVPTPQSAPTSIPLPSPATGAIAGRVEDLQEAAARPRLRACEGTLHKL